MTTGDPSPLIKQIDARVVPAGELAIWALGQAGFVLKGGGAIAYIDPYLSGPLEESPGNLPGTFSRLFPPPALPEQVTNAGIVFCTHEHDDHTDPLTLAPLAAASPRAVFVGPWASRDILRQIGVSDERIIVPEAYKPMQVAGLTFTALPAAHYGLDHDPRRGYRYLGFVIEQNGVTLYHAGDTILYAGLGERLQCFAIDIACLPVNGRDWYREQQGFTGNLDPREATELVAAIGARVFIPMHNDMFAANRVNPAYLADLLDHHQPRQRYHWLQPGEVYYYTKVEL